MATQIEYVDVYRQRYVTSILPVILGSQITTEVYTPFVYGQPIQSRTIQLDNNRTAVEVFGMIDTKIQTFDVEGMLVAEGQQFEQAWIEMWVSCMEPISNNLARNINNCIMSAVDHIVTIGPAFVTPGDANMVVWGDVDGAGVPLPPGVGNTDLQFIDVWA